MRAGAEAAVGRRQAGRKDTLIMSSYETSDARFLKKAILGLPRNIRSAGPIAIAPRCGARKAAYVKSARRFRL